MLRRRLSLARASTGTGGVSSTSRPQSNRIGAVRSLGTTTTSVSPLRKAASEAAAENWLMWGLWCAHPWSNPPPREQLHFSFLKNDRGGMGGHRDFKEKCVIPRPGGDDILWHFIDFYSEPCPSRRLLPRSPTANESPVQLSSTCETKSLRSFAPLSRATGERWR